MSKTLVGREMLPKKSATSSGVRMFAWAATGENRCKEFISTRTKTLREKKITDIGDDSLKLR
jgi:hypothetical protein